MPVVGKDATPSNDPMDGVVGSGGCHGACRARTSQYDDGCYEYCDYYEYCYEYYYD